MIELNASWFLALPLTALFAVFLILAWRRNAAFFGAVLIILLFHEYVLRVAENLMGVSPAGLLAISLWKEVAIAALLIVWFVKYVVVKDRPVPLRWLPVDTLMMVWVAYSVVVAVLSPNRLSALAVLRDYFEPVLFYFGVRLVLLSKRQTRSLLASWVGLGLVLAIFAIWQGLTWSPGDYVAWGYGAPTSQVGIPYRNVLGRYIIRPLATLTSPNELAVHLMLLSLFVAQRGSLRQSWRGLARLVIVMVYVGAILVTTSRSGIFGLMLGLAVLAVAHLPRKLASWLHRRALWIGLGLAMVVVVAGLIVMISSPDRGLAGELWARIASDYHVVDTLAALQFLLSHPAGVGLGLVGPRQGFGISAVLPYHVEGSLFQVGMETGLVGLALFLLVLGVSIVRVVRIWRPLQDPLLRAICGTAFAGWMGALVAFAFLPLMQALPLMAWLWFFLGMALSADRLESQWAEPLGAAQQSVRPVDSGANVLLASD